MADVDIDIEVDDGDSVSTLRDLNRDLESLEGSTGKAAAGLDALGGAAQSLSGLMHAGDQRANELARAHLAVERAADDLATANNDLKRSQLDVNRAELDGKQAATDAKRARLEQAQAQKAYNQAVKEFGPNSTEAKTAALDLEDANIRVKDADLSVKEAEQDKKEAVQDGKTAMVDAKESSQELKESQQELAKTEGPEGAFMWIVQMGTDILGLVALFALLGGSALLSAASVALSWLIAFWPLILIGLLVAAFVALVIIYWDEIKAALAAAWAWLKENVFAPIGRFFSETIPRWAGIVKEKIIQAWNAIKTGVKSAWDWIVNNIFNPIKTFFTQTIPGWATTVKNKIVNAWTAIKERVKSLVSGIVNWVKDKWNGLISFFTSLPGKISRAVSGMFNGVKNAFRSALNWIIGKWNNFSFSIGGGSFMGVSIPRVTISTPNIPYLADGGITTGPTMAMIGEGKEQEAVLPLSKLQGMMDMGGSREVHLVIDLQGGDSEFRNFFQSVVRNKGGGSVVKFAGG